MKIIRQTEIIEENVTDTPIFFGGEVNKLSIVDSSISNDYTFAIVKFAKGAKNKFHAHSSDQILFVTEGHGLVATEANEVSIQQGDSVFIPAGEKHWHGATSDSNFAHISLTGANSTTKIY